MSAEICIKPLLGTHARAQRGARFASLGLFSCEERRHEPVLTLWFFDCGFAHTSTGPIFG
jgi:hypothetical protein